MDKEIKQELEKILGDIDSLTNTISGNMIDQEVIKRLFINNDTTISDINEFLHFCREQNIDIDIKEDGTLPDCVYLEDDVDENTIKGFILDFMNNYDYSFDDENYDDEPDDYMETGMHFGDPGPQGEKGYDRHSIHESNMEYFDYSELEPKKPTVHDVNNITLDISKFNDMVTKEDVTINIIELINPEDDYSIEFIGEMQKFLKSSCSKYKNLLSKKVTDRDAYYKIHCSRMNYAEEMYLEIFKYKKNYITNILDSRAEFFKSQLREDCQSYMINILNILLYLTDLVVGTVAAYLTEFFDSIFADIRSEFICVTTILDLGVGE